MWCRRFTSCQRIDRPLCGESGLCVGETRSMWLRMGCPPSHQRTKTFMLYRAVQSMLTAARRSIVTVTRRPLQPHPTALEDQYWSTVLVLACGGGVWQWWLPC